MNVLIVDNRDSFTFNLVQLVAKVAGTEPLVLRNDHADWPSVVADRGADAVLISPGPGSPDKARDFGTCRELILQTKVPLLGVCLGHQGLGHAYGAAVRRAEVPMHGRVSRVTHFGCRLFEGIPRSFDAVRYHSLCLDRASLPSCLTVTALSDDGVAMAVRHERRLQFGVQFHPESVAGQCGERLIRNFLRIAAGDRWHGATEGDAHAAASGTTRKFSFHKSSETCVRSRVLDRWVEPQQAFEALFCRSDSAFWLDSSEIVPGFSRFSAMGDASGPRCEVLLYSVRQRAVTVRRGGIERTTRIGSLSDEIRRRLARRVRLDDALPFDFQTGLAGFFGYEMRGEFGPDARESRDLPDAAFIDTDRCLVFDHLARGVFLVARTSTSGEAERWFDEVSRVLVDGSVARYRPMLGRGTVIATLPDGPQRYAEKVRACQEEIAAGESYQICLSSEFAVDCDAAPYDAYRRLRALNPAPHAAYLRFGDLAVLSSSPERFLRVGRDRTVSAKPIKGTCGRGADPASDRRLADWLRSDEKCRSENLMIVDLLRNDIGRVATTGSVNVPKLMDVESYSTVHQLVSTVTGRLRDDKDCLDCLAAAFPGGSMTGAPKLRTLSIIDRLERRARGPYSGALGFLSYGGRMDLSIVIRTIVMQGSSVAVGSGGGIVALSDPRAEFHEMLLKARAPLRALAAASTGDPDDWNLRYLTD